MNGKNWQELDFRVASDYTHGSPEYYRTLLRQMIGLPTLLPGEKSEVHKQKSDRQKNTNRKSDKGYMSSFLQQG